MTLRGADLRFALPVAVRSAVVLGADRDVRLAAIAAGLAAAGVEVRGRPGAQAADLVAATAAEAVGAMSVPATAHVLLGRPTAQAGAGRAGRRTLLVRGDPAHPTAILPVHRGDALGYYLGQMSAPSAALPRWRSRVLAAAAGGRVPVGRMLPGRAVVTAVTPAGGPSAQPLLIRAAREVGVPPDVGWVLSLGTGDDLQRAVFHLLDRGRPRWVLKFARVAGHETPFSRDEEGLRLAANAGPVVGAHAPALLGRLDVGGIPASVETAAVGRPLLHRLDGTDRGATTALVERVAAWVVATGVATATPAGALCAERARLEREVLPRWRRAGAPADLVRTVPVMPGVLQHNDLGSWNIVTDGCGFTAIDWESARAVGLPLWDLLYLLGDCLPRLDGRADADVLTARALAVFRGQSPWSATLFEWVRRAAAALDVPQEAVGPVATLCWLHHGLSADARRVALAGAAPAAAGHLARLAGRWLADPALGPGWAAWSAWCRR